MSSEINADKALVCAPLPQLTEEEISGIAGGNWSTVGDKVAIGGSIGYASSGTLKGAAIGALGAGAMSLRNGDSTRSGRVICTHFYRKGMIDRDVWRADLEFTAHHLSEKTVRGYQYWAIPYVRLMRRSPLAERIMFPLATWRAEELAYQMGMRTRGNWKGKIVRVIGESICFSIGLFVGEQDWQKLWSEEHPAKS
ncbi:MAG: hypothetical protein H6R00_949 [Proteobacteria bacterium]|nr:hypothetical protein [Pseudomonadota bacterium]